MRRYRGRARAEKIPAMRIVSKNWLIMDKKTDEIKITRSSSTVLLMFSEFIFGILHMRIAASSPDIS
jgi:hypothetical protein